MNLIISPIKINSSITIKTINQQYYSSTQLKTTIPVNFKAGALRAFTPPQEILDNDVLNHYDDYQNLAVKCAREKKDTNTFYKELISSLKNNIDKFQSKDSTTGMISEYISEATNIEMLSEFLEKNAYLYKTGEVHELASYFYLEKMNRPSWFRHFSISTNLFGCLSRTTAVHVNTFLEEQNKIKLQNIKSKEQNINEKILSLRKINNAKETISFDFIEKIVLVKNFQNDEGIENQKIRNSILIEHPSSHVRKDLINWVLESSDCNKLAVKNNDSLLLEPFVKKLKTALEYSEKTYKEKGIPSLVYVEDMEKFISNDIPKAKKGAMKSLLQDCYKKYHATMIFDTSTSANIDSTSMQPHRTLHIDILNDPIIERIKNRQSEMKLNPNLDGLRMTYGSGSNDYVDLFSGCFGHSNEVLWINTNDIKKIKLVVEKLDIIKRAERFSQIKKLQCPCMDEILPGFCRLNDKTISGENIYEKEV